MRTRLLASLALLVGWTSADAMIMAFNVPTSETIFTTAEVDGFLFTSEHFHLMGDGYFAPGLQGHCSHVRLSIFDQKPTVGLLAVLRVCPRRRARPSFWRT